MLDFNNLDFSNICENWFLNFNDFLKDDKFNYDNLFLSPHISGNFPEYQTDMIKQFIENLIYFLNGKALKNRICKKRLY